MNWHRMKNIILFQESAGSATSSWSLQKCQPQLISDSTWPRFVWKSTHFRPGGDCNRWGGENDGKIDGKMMVCLKHTLKSLKPTKVFGRQVECCLIFWAKVRWIRPIHVYQPLARFQISKCRVQWCTGRPKTSPGCNSKSASSGS